jgi:hypothetical protein
MHHTLGLYGRHQHRLLHVYMAAARLTGIPLFGRIARLVANTYGKHGHSGYFLKLSEAEEIVDIAGSVSLGPCSCRAEFHNCDYPVMSEIVLGNGSSEVYASRKKEFRQISKSEAKEILSQAHKNHLTQSIMRCGNHFYAICNCCSCCCVPSRLRQEFNIGHSLVRNPHVVEDFRRMQI